MLTKRAVKNNTTGLLPACELAGRGESRLAAVKQLAAAKSHSPHYDKADKRNAAESNAAVLLSKTYRILGKWQW